MTMETGLSNSCAAQVSFLNKHNLSGSTLKCTMSIASPQLTAGLEKKTMLQGASWSRQGRANHEEFYQQLEPGEVAVHKRTRLKLAAVLHVVQIGNHWLRISLFLLQVNKF